MHRTISTTPNAPGKTLTATAPGWSEWVIGWHVYPLGFVGAPIREKDQGAAPINQIRKLIDWLPYVQEFGLNVLQLAPIFESTSHGYDTEDYYRINSRLDTGGDMKAVIETAHEHGVEVLLGGVFNHIGSGAPALKTAKENPDSEEAQLFAFTHSTSNMTAPVFEDHESLVEFDHTSGTTVDFVANVMNYWLVREIDDQRLDAAYAVDPQFWHRVLPQVRTEHPHAFIYDEVIHDDYVEIVPVSGMNSVTEYELWKATWSVLKEENFFELDWALRHRNTFAEFFVPVAFVGNRNVSHIATQVGTDKAVLTATVLLTVAGVPLVCYGDEQGYTGLRKEHIGGSDQIRPVSPDCPEELSTLGADLYRVYQQLAAVRRHFPWLYSVRVEADELRNGFFRHHVTAADAALMDDATGASGEVGASGKMPSLIAELNLESGATSTVIRDDDHVEFEFSQALIAALGCSGEPKSLGHHVRAVILSCPIGE